MPKKPPPLDPLALREALRKSEDELVAALGPAGDGLTEKNFKIPVSESYNVDAIAWIPKDKTNMPLILLFHGGGFMSGSCKQCTRPAREFATAFDAVVISADYRLAPEHKFPQAMLDGLTVTEWLDANASTAFGADLAKGFVVGGFSAGGHTATIVASEARVRNFKHQITGLFNCIPTVFTENIVPPKYLHEWTSRHANANENWDKTTIDQIFANMAADTSLPLFSPVNGSKGLHGFPPTYVQVGDKDLLRDDGIVFHKLLADAGIPTKLDCYPELGHESWTIWTDEKTEIGRKLEEKTLSAMRWLLKGETHGSESGA